MAVQIYIYGLLMISISKKNFMHSLRLQGPHDSAMMNDLDNIATHAIIDI